MSSAEGHHLVKIKLGKRGSAGSRPSRARGSCIFMSALSLPTAPPPLPAAAGQPGSPRGGGESWGHGSYTAHLFTGRALLGLITRLHRLQTETSFTSLLLAFSALSSFGDPANIPRKLRSMMFKTPCEQPRPPSMAPLGTAQEPHGAFFFPSRSPPAPVAGLLLLSLVPCLGLPFPFSAWWIPLSH